MPKRVRELTNIEVKNLSKIVGFHNVGRVPGLKLRVTQIAGGRLSALWVLRVRENGKETQRSLGNYPEVSLSEARELANEYLTQIKNGLIPFHRKAQKQEITNEEITFREAFEEWEQHYLTSVDKPKDALKNLRYIKVYLLESLANCPLKALKTKEIAEAISPIWYSKPAVCSKIAQVFSAFFKWCYINKEYRNSPENIGSEKFLKLFFGKAKRKESQNQPYIPPERIPELVRSVFTRGAVTDYALIFTIMSALRNGNGRSVRWDQIKVVEYQGVSYPVIEFNKEEMKVSKNGQHLVPLSKEHQAILTIMKGYKTAYNPHVFPGHSDGGALSDSALKLSIKASNKREIQAGRAGWIDPVTNRVAVPHGLARASFETWAVQNKIDKRIIDLAQHHRVSDYNGAYDRDITLGDKAKALQAWSSFCCSLIEKDLMNEAERIRKLLEN